jgi:hypothetical protein
MSSPSPNPVPTLLAERFADTFANLVAGLNWAVQAAPSHPGFAAPTALASLRQRALPTLNRQLAAIESAMSAYRSGDPTALVSAARTAQTLSRDLDGYNLNINRTGDFLHQELTFVILAAYQVVTAAGAA